MPRKLSAQYVGAVYHVMKCGDRREPIFHEDTDRELFLGHPAEACQNTDLGGACLLPYGKSLPPGGRDAQGKPGGWHKEASGRLHGALQPTAQTLWPPLQRTLQGASY